MVGTFNFGNGPGQIGYLYDSISKNYTMILPYFFPGLIDVDLLDINDSGQAFGSSLHNSGRYDGYVYNSKTNVHSMIIFPVSRFYPPRVLGNTYAKGVNDSGQVIGEFIDPDDGFRVCYMLDNETHIFTEINPPGSTDSSVVGINNSGQVIGHFSDSAGRYFGFLYDSATESYTVIAPAGSTYSDAYRINNSGQVIGHFQDSAGRSYGFLYDSASGNYTVIDPPGYNLSALSLTVRRINDSGQVIVGFDTSSGGYEGFLYDSSTGSYTRIGLPGISDVVPREINNSGQVTGYYYDGDKGYGFLYDGSRFITFEPPGSTSVSELIINDSGQITGGYYYGGGMNFQWFLLEFDGL